MTEEYSLAISETLSIINSAKNHLNLSFEINNIVKAITKYISTAPVSGSKNVITEGIIVIINTLNIRINSSFIDTNFVLSITFAK